MSTELVDILRRRAESFLKISEELLARGVLDIAAFCIEQACQLRLKATLLRLFSEYPKIHSIREIASLLVRRLSDVGFREVAEKLAHFVREQRDLLVILDDVYISSRYGIFTLTADDLRKLLDLAKTLFRLLDEVEKCVLG